MVTNFYYSVLSHTASNLGDVTKDKNTEQGQALGVADRAAYMWMAGSEKVPDTIDSRSLVA
jgi:hypothetical protein